jgi:hypothetical protein
VVDRAITQQARAALDRLANDAGERSGGARGGIVGGPEDGDGRDAQGRGDMHAAGIVCQENPAGGGQLYEFTEPSPARQIAGIDT